MSNLLLSVMRAIGPFEKELIRERQREGIAIAKREGKYRGRKPSLTPRGRPSCDGELLMVTQRLRLLVSSASAGIPYYRYVPVKKRRTRKLGK
jgi:DNA invertase Pin-like site-specific DNA recombinase